MSIRTFLNELALTMSFLLLVNILTKAMIMLDLKLSQNTGEHFQNLLAISRMFQCGFEKLVKSPNGFWKKAQKNDLLGRNYPRL